jgi:hypothetical protein
VTGLEISNDASSSIQINDALFVGFQTYIRGGDFNNGLDFFLGTHPVSSERGITGSDGTAGTVSPDMFIRAGDGYVVGNNAGGALTIVSGAGNGSGADGIITIDALSSTLNLNGTSVLVNGSPIAGSGSDLDLTTTSTAGGTITLDMNSQKERIHVGTASFATAKTVAMSNTTNALVFSFKIEVTDVAAVLTMPADWTLTVGTWDGADWTPPATGKYKFVGTWDGSEWAVDVNTSPYN